METEHPSEPVSDADSDIESIQNEPSLGCPRSLISKISNIFPDQFTQDCLQVLNRVFSSYSTNHKNVWTPC